MGLESENKPAAGEGQNWREKIR